MQAVACRKVFTVQDCITSQAAGCRLQENDLLLVGMFMLLWLSEIFTLFPHNAETQYASTPFGERCDASSSNKTS